MTSLQTKASVYSRRRLQTVELRGRASRRAEKRAFVWMSYDLGIQGDYEGLYRWLAGHEAKECGDGMAAFSFAYRADLIKELTADLKKNVDVKKRARIYVVSQKDEKPVGKFVIGGRKDAPWTGYAVQSDDGEDGS
jgi:hypothetical protein